jgi:hypothetical protein
MIIPAILELLFSIALFINGGHLIDNKFKVHHYSDEDYKEIFFLQAKKEISKECTKHSIVETITYKNSHRDGKTQRNYSISDPYPIQDTPQQDTFNSQRKN